jgi:hypothetical protein
MLLYAKIIMREIRLKAINHQVVTLSLYLDSILQSASASAVVTTRAAKSYRESSEAYVRDGGSSRVDLAGTLLLFGIKPIEHQRWRR